MSEFTPITTQEQFDAAIAARIRREKENAAKKYAGFDELKETLATREKELADVAATVNDLRDRLAAADRRACVAEVAHTYNLSPAMAARLSGDDMESLSEDAEFLLESVRQQIRRTPRAPEKSTEPAGSGKTSEKMAYKALASQLTNND